MNILTEKIQILLNTKKNIIIALDGRAAAGKTTLATRLYSEFEASIIHMDHFFLPLDLRGEKRVNVHYERFLEEVFPQLKARLSFTYRIFDCSVMDYQGIQEVEMKPLIIIEGAYSLLPFWDGIIDLRIFLDIDPETQKARIINRNGTEGYRAFSEKWIPLEEEYIREYKVIERSEIIMT